MRSTILLPLFVLLVETTACHSTRSSSERVSIDKSEAVNQHGSESTRPAESAIEKPASPKRPWLQDYPRGRWRLAPYPEVKRVVLWAAHILIRHKDVLSGRDAPFTAVGWQPLGPLPSMSRDEALARARRVAAQARQHPSEFASIARETSDDAMTRDEGGALGAIPVGEWAIGFPEVVDVLATLQPGQVSDVVETVFGFHVFYRQPPPPEQQIAARRIVVGYDDAPFLNAIRRGPEQKRTRSDALALARRILIEAQRAPATFASLAERYSEAEDAEQDGDLGVWSNREPSPFSRELSALAALRVGEIAGPIDTKFGFQIVQRTPVEERAKYAVESVRLRFDSRAPASEPTSKQAVREQARRVAAALAANPERIGEFQEMYGRMIREQWTRGRGILELTKALDKIAIGEVTKEPLEKEGTFIITRRLDPELQKPAPEPLFELPSPAAPDLLYEAESARNRRLVDILKLAREASDQTPEDGGTHSARCAQAFGGVEDAIRNTENPRVRRERFVTALSQVKHCLGAGDYDRYVAKLNGVFEEQVLRPRKNP